MRCHLKLFTLLLLLIAGCSPNKRAEMEQKVGQDHVMMVSRYQAAGVNEVESVLNEFLALADDYERRGWGKLGAPGWINDLRGLCEARLAVYFEATGKRDQFQVHMGRALEHFKKVNPGVNPTEAGTREGIERLDAANIQPRWRTELRSGPAAAGSFQTVSPITPAPPD